MLAKLKKHGTAFVLGTLVGASGAVGTINPENVVVKPPHPGHGGNVLQCTVAEHQLFQKETLDAVNWTLKTDAWKEFGCLFSKDYQQGECHINFPVGKDNDIKSVEKSLSPESIQKFRNIFNNPYLGQLRCITDGNQLNCQIGSHYDIKDVSEVPVGAQCNVANPGSQGGQR